MHHVTTSALAKREGSFGRLIYKRALPFFFQLRLNADSTSRTASAKAMFPSNSIRR
jgi:hypothetical protein